MQRRGINGARHADEHSELNSLLEEALRDVEAPLTEDFLNERCGLVCVVLQTVLKQLEANASEQSVTQTHKALELVQKEVERRPAVLLRRAQLADHALAPQQHNDELCFWLLPRLVRILAALAQTPAYNARHSLKLAKDVMVQSLRALCSSALVAEEGLPKAREILLEVLRLCGTLCPLIPETLPPTQYLLFAESSVEADGEVFRGREDANQRPYRVTIKPTATLFVALHLLEAAAQVALAPHETEPAQETAQTTLCLAARALSLRTDNDEARGARAGLASEVLRAAFKSGTALASDWQPPMDAITSGLRLAVDMNPLSEVARDLDHVGCFSRLCASDSAPGSAARQSLEDLVLQQGGELAERIGDDLSHAATVHSDGRWIAAVLLVSFVSLSPPLSAYTLLEPAHAAAFEAQLLAWESEDVDRDRTPTAFLDALRVCPIMTQGETSRKRKRGVYEPATSPAPAPKKAVTTWVQRANLVVVGELLRDPISTPGDFQHILTKLINAAYDQDEQPFKETMGAIARLAHAFGCEADACKCRNGSVATSPGLRAVDLRISESLAKMLNVLCDSKSPTVPAKRPSLIRALTACLSHTKAARDSVLEKELPKNTKKLLEASSRSARISAGQLYAVYLRHRQLIRPWPPDCPHDVDLILKALSSASLEGPVATRQTAVWACVEIAKFAEEDLLSQVLLILVKAFATDVHEPLFLQMIELAPLRASTNYKLMAPHLRAVGPYLAGLLARDEGKAGWPLKRFASFLGVTVEALYMNAVVHLVPTLVSHKSKEGLKSVARAQEKEIGELCSVQATPILVYIFLDMPHGDRKEVLDWLLTVMPENVDLKVIVDAHLTNLLCAMFMELGSEREGKAVKVAKALEIIDCLRGNKRKSSSEAVSQLLSSQVLAILTRISDELNDMFGRRTNSEKCCIVRGLGHFIAKVGPNIASVAPQIMAALQSTLRTDGLREATLGTWYIFVSVQKYETVGPLIGSTSAAIVREWLRFSLDEQVLATKILNWLIADNAVSLKRHVEEIADLSGIPELQHIAHSVEVARGKRSSFALRLDSAITRVASENDSIELQGLRDLSKLLRKPAALAPLASGDTFHAVLGRLVSVLTDTITRDSSGREESRDLAYRCIGLVGPLDPDRLDIPAEEPPLVVLHNFYDPEENLRFCMHLVKHVLVGAYRSSIELRHQTALAYAIQELLKYCGLTKDVTAPIASVLRETPQQKIWHDLPPAVLETIAPLLDSRFELTRSVSAVGKYPFYTTTTTYRDWLRGWALALIERCRTQKSGKIFGVISSAVKFSDVGVSQQLMPHLVLTVMLSGSSAERDSMRSEFISVLRDQLEPKSMHSADSRSLCAQTVFGLMDHIGRYLRLRKVQKPIIKGHRNLQTAADREADTANRVATEKVEDTMGKVDHDLQARAALESRSFSRSLLNFEVVVKSMDKDPLRDVAKCQSYLERLHQVYAELDEPDGMEGISTRLIAPSVWTQIREHESTGRWTSAQSCWEVQLQTNAEEPKSHIGLLKCLRNLGHYDSMRTHIAGVLQDHADWRAMLAPFEIESALIFGDWESLESALEIPGLSSHEAAFGRLLMTMRAGDEDSTRDALSAARQQIGSSILAAGNVSYQRSYDTFLDLSVLHELEVIFTAAKGNEHSKKLLPKLMTTRLEASSPAFRVRESLLNMRRAGLRLSAMPNADSLIGPMWLETAKIARKAGHVQTSYSAVLRAAQLQTPATFLQSAQLKHDDGQAQKAIQELAIALSTDAEHLIQQKKHDEILAKAALRSARWKDEAGRFERNDVTTLFRQAALLKKEWETPHYDLGHYYDEQWKHLLEASRKIKLTANDADLALRLPGLVVSNLHAALKYGSKYVYQALPRLVTIWLELGTDPQVIAYAEAKEAEKSRSQQIEFSASVQHQYKVFEQVHNAAYKASKDLPGFQWLTVYPQLVARIMHRNKRARKLLKDLLIKTMNRYPEQCLWWIVGSVKSTQRDRAKVCQSVCDESRTIDARLATPINHCLKLVEQLLVVCDAKVDDKQPEMILSEKVPGLARSLPSTMIIPLQSSMIATMPPRTADASSYLAFPADLPTFQRVQDVVDVMSSVARPRKVTFLGSDGQKYPFLLKPKDDLRKDARMMDFNAMINKLLKRDTESRRRRLHVRTYGVVPLNETCGIIEWVPNVMPLRPTLIKLYEARGMKKWYNEELRQVMEGYRQNPDDAAERFKKDLIDKWPGVFHEWFLDTFPEPSAWLRARLAYARTYAVMAMVGFVVGLGDRHCENILFDSNTGEVLHVDLNCLFEGGKLFEISEKVPFRLTTNIIDALGVTGVEGVFRRACEVAMRILRHNRDSLMSVLEAFVHDPLTEWTGNDDMRKKRKSDETDRVTKNARKALNTIESKLRGTRITHESSDKAIAHPPEVQVDSLIKEASDLSNLAQMYIGWISYW